MNTLYEGDGGGEPVTIPRWPWSLVVLAIGAALAIWRWWRDGKAWREYQQAVAAHIKAEQAANIARLDRAREAPAEAPPRDWSDFETPSIPADDPIYSEGLIITFPIRPTRAEADEGETKSAEEAVE